MFLSYLALAILVIMIIVIVYVFIWIHDIPYMLAKRRNHPNLHAIHIGCWLSLFTLHALWPFIFLWAIIRMPRLQVVVVEDQTEQAKTPSTDGEMGLSDTESLRRAITGLQQRLDILERQGGNRG